MCGIAGYAYLDGRPLTDDDQAILDRMGHAISHRGPDDTRSMRWRNVGFVFKRLSIVDVSHGGQPLESPDGRLCVIANGEIYNHRALRADLAQRHRLVSRSDCAVLAPLYLERDLDLLREVNGMFALALLDRAQHRLLLARDRMGVKPLFYCIADDGRMLAFASEIKALLAHPAVPRRFDWVAALASLSNADTLPREYTSGFRGIDRVPAAGIVDVDLRNGSIRTHGYWSLPPPASDAEAAPAQHYVDRYRELLEDSVRLRLPDEVPFGVFLSGGIDSVAIAAIAARRARFPTFTVLSASTAADADYADAIARRLSLPHHALLFDSTSAAVTPDHWREVLWSCELPGATAEQLYKFHLHAHARARYPDLKVMLLGQGSDEFNGGYIAWTLGTQGSWDASHWDAMHRELVGVDLRAATAQAGFGSALQEPIDRGVLAGDFIRAAAGRPRDAGAWRLYAGRYRGNLDYHLWHEDRTAAAHAIEDRVPFLDYRLLEHVASVPACRHAALFTDKQILRRAVSGLLPAEFAKRPKGYFFYGRAQRHTLRMMYRLLLANDGELVEQAVAGSARTDGPLDAARLRAWIAELGRRPDLAGLTRVLHLINMGVLADLAARGGPTPATPAPRLGLESTIDAWSRTREGGAALARARGAERAEDVVVALPHGCAVVDLRASTSPALAAGVYVVTDGQLGARIASPAWARFLLLVDGRHSVAQILATAQLNRARTWRLVHSALDDGSLVEVDAASEIATPLASAAPSPMAAD